MTSNPRRSNSTQRNRIRNRLAAMSMPCALCGQPIDYSLPPGNPMSFEVDEIVPVSCGGDPLDINNCQPAHRICNQRRGNKPLSALNVRPLTKPPTTSTDW